MEERCEGNESPGISMTIKYIFLKKFVISRYCVVVNFKRLLFMTFPTKRRHGVESFTKLFRAKPASNLSYFSTKKDENALNRDKKSLDYC